MTKPDEPEEGTWAKPVEHLEVVTIGVRIGTTKRIPQVPWQVPWRSRSRFEPGRTGLTVVAADDVQPKRGAFQARIANRSGACG